MFPFLFGIALAIAVGRYMATHGMGRRTPDETALYTKWTNLLATDKAAAKGAEWAVVRWDHDLSTGGAGVTLLAQVSDLHQAISLAGGLVPLTPANATLLVLDVHNPQDPPYASLQGQLLPKTLGATS